MMTGADLATNQLEGQAPAGFDVGPTDRPDDARVATDPDERLPWPDPAAVRAWWNQRGSGFPDGKRLLWGSPPESPWLEQVLRAERQPVRAAAAIELGLRQPGRPLFPVRAPARRQLRALAALGRA
jgi:uncharacterized protein (TIGR02270 family)